MKYLQSIALLACIVVVGCAGGDEGGHDVTPMRDGSGTGRTVLQPLPIERFTGLPTRIGFEPIALEADGVQSLTDFAFLPDSSEFLAINRDGFVGYFRLMGSRAVLIGSFQIPSVYVAGDCTMNSVEIDPAFSSNRLFYVSYCIDAGYSVVKRFTLSENDVSDSVYSSSTIVAVGDSAIDVPAHGIGTLAFASDGMMWANVADRGHEEHAQDLTDELGKIIRFQPSKRVSVHGFTPAGAFLRDLPKSELVYAYGFRNPWRGAFDTRGRYWVADAGKAYQEVNVVTTPGQNFGWPLSDGPVCYVDHCTDMVRPIRSWDVSPRHRFILDDPLVRDASSSRMAWVGIEYRPVANDPYKGLLTGKMIYGDFFAGFVRGIALDSDGRVVSDGHLGHIDHPVAWRQGQDGFLYVATMSPSPDHEAQETTGALWRVVPLP